MTSLGGSSVPLVRLGIRTSVAARTTGLDTVKFSACFDTQQFAPQIDQDLFDATELGIRGTPTYVVNGRRIEGVIPEEQWNKIILEELKKKQ